MSPSSPQPQSTGQETWARRLAMDIARAEANQTPDLAAVTREVHRRCRRDGAAGLVLTGSTARGRRTQVSDLDYHVIGARPDTGGLPQEVDLYSHGRDEFVARLRAGDDFVHWTVRYGCVLFDDGTLEAAAELIGSERLWPDVDRKRDQAGRTLAFSERLIDSGDYDAALEQTRGALSLTARWWLLHNNVFPLARDELSGQLRVLRCHDLADGLHQSIHGRPSELALTSAITAAWGLIEEVESPRPRR